MRSEQEIRTRLDKAFIDFEDCCKPNGYRNNDDDILTIGEEISILSWVLGEDNSDELYKIRNQK